MENSKSNLFPNVLKRRKVEYLEFIPETQDGLNKAIEILRENNFSDYYLDAVLKNYEKGERRFVISTNSDRLNIFPSQGYADKTTSAESLNVDLFFFNSNLK